MGFSIVENGTTSPIARHLNICCTKALDQMKKDPLLKQDDSESFGNIKEFLLVVQKH